MEFMSRGQNPAPTPKTKAKHFDWEARAVRIEWFIFTSLVALVLLFVIGWSALSNSSLGYSEANQIDSNKYQAVFLNGGSTSGSVAYTTYFGHVTKLTDKYMILKNVYYLTTDQTSTSGAANPQLTKLGCQQLHSPYDEMVINRSQVAFWENLQDNGKVVSAIKQYVQANPNGPNCSTASTSSSSTSTQSTTSSQNSSATTP